MYNFRKLTAIVAVLLAGCLLIGGPAFAIVAPDKTLSGGTVEGAIGDTVSLPIALDDATGIGGVAFTLKYDPAVFEFVGLEKAIKDISDGSEYQDPTSGDYVVPDGQEATVGATMFYQFNNDADNGKLMVAAASAHALTDTALFNARFKITSGNGTYPIGVLQTIIQNPDAGYTAPTLLPALVGMPADQPNDQGYYPTPIFTADLVDGSITVQAPGYAISGSVTYNDGSSTAANGSTVTLKRVTAAGNVFVASVTVRNGTYQFTSVPAGTYRLSVTPYDSNYYTATADVSVVGQNVAKDIVLQQATPVSGTVTVNGGAIPGLKVKVMNGNEVIGVYAADSSGYFQTAPLPPGVDFTFTAVYGNVEIDITNDLADNTANVTIALQNLSGSIAGLGVGEDVAVQAVSQTGKLTQTQLITADADPMAYTMVNLVQADDYVVSAVTAGKPVQYYQDETDITLATEVDLTQGDQAGIDFNFANVDIATLGGQVIKDAAGQPDISVYAFDVNTYASTAELTDNDGNFTMTVAPGDYNVFAESDGKYFFAADGNQTTTSLAEARVFTVAAQDEITDIAIDLTEPCTCTLSGTVSFERIGGDPVAGALVTAIAPDGYIADAAFTLQDGSFKLYGLCADTDYLIEMDPMIGGYAIQTPVIPRGWTLSSMPAACSPVRSPIKRRAIRSPKPWSIWWTSRPVNSSAGECTIPKATGPTRSGISKMVCMVCLSATRIMRVLMKPSVSLPIR